MLPRMLAGVAMLACASWPLCAEVAHQDGRASPSSPKLSAAPVSPRVQSATVVYDAREPLVVDVEATPGAACSPTFTCAPFTAPKVSGVVLINLRGLPLRFERLPPAARKCDQATYETEYAKGLRAVVTEIQRQAPGCAIGVIGLPFEGNGAAAANEHFGPVLESLAVMAPTGGLLVGGQANAALALRGRFVASLADPKGRPVLFKGGGGWKVAATRSASRPGGRQLTRGTGASAPNGQPSDPTTPLASNQKSETPESSKMSEGAPSPITVAQVLTGWGTSDPSSDVDGDGKVNGADLAYALALNPDTMPPPADPNGGGDGDPPSEPDLSPILVPGAGFTGATPTPSAVGDANDPAYDCTPGVRWTTVPYQSFSDQLVVGLVAFQLSGLDRVEFAVNGGAWAPVTSMRKNPQTGVKEYYATLRASDFPDGPVEVRAVCYPESGQPRVVDSLNLFANAGGSMTGGVLYVSNDGQDAPGGGQTPANPLKTITSALYQMRSNLAAYDGGKIVILKAGEYDIDPPIQMVINDRWITIEPDPSLPPLSVVIDAGEWTEVRPKTRRLRFEKLAFDFSRMYQMYKDDADAQWYDQCTWFQSGGWSTMGPGQTYAVRNEGYGGLYITNSNAHDLLYAFAHANLVRSSSVQNVSGDAFQNSLAVIDCTADSIVEGPIPGWHTDAFQYFGTFESVIIYGCRISNVDAAQSVFLDHDNSSFTNFFVVNVAFDNVNCNPPLSQFASHCKQVVFSHVTLPQQWLELRDDSNFVGDDVAFINCVFQKVQRGTWNAPGLPHGVNAVSCHFEAGELHGSNPTAGPVTVTFGQDGSVSYSGSGAAALIGSAVVLPDGIGIGSTNRGAQFTVP